MPFSDSSPYRPKARCIASLNCATEYGLGSVKVRSFSFLYIDVGTAQLPDMNTKGKSGYRSTDS